MEFLMEMHMVAQCYIRGWGNLVSRWLESADFHDLSTIPPELIPGILEAYADWLSYAPEARTGAENPFGRFNGALLELIALGLHRDNAGRIFYFSNFRMESELNLRLGLALDAYSAMTGQSDWGAVGRSIALSALGLIEPLGASLSGTAPASLDASVQALSGPGAMLLAEDGSFRADPLAPRISAAGFYRDLDRPYYPRAAWLLQFRGATLWAWTAAGDVRGTELPGNVVEIEVAFPPGETHYMMIRGVRPFNKIQLYDMDYRTDPQFERYESSGWSYNSQEQTLIVKMQHRSQVERIRVFFGE